jgi:hypothetical protein
MGESELATLSATIEIMTAKTRAAFLDCREDPVPGPGSRRWWVLLCGAPLNSGDLAQRDAARAELRQRASELGLTVRECVWVWDETDRTQLLAGVFAARTQAEGFARSLAEKGCEVRVTPAFDDPD